MKFRSIFLGSIICLFASLGIGLGIGYIRQRFFDRSQTQVSSRDFNSSDAFFSYVQIMRSKEWDESKFPVNAEILSFSASESALELRYTWPPQIDGLKRRVKMLCNEDEFFFEDASVDKFNLKKEKISPSEFFLIIEEGKRDEVHFKGLCTNKTCDEIYQLCVVVKT